MENILVMGASGFLGSQLVIFLNEFCKDYKIYHPSHAELDALDFDAVSSFIREHDIQYVFHAAANHAGIGSGVSKELFFLESNMIMNLNLVKASYENNIKKFITFGTACCYNNPSKEIFTEADYWINKSEITYGTCKRVMLDQLSLQEYMPWVYLVPPNLYGPGDHFGDKTAHFVSATITKFDETLKSTGDRTVTVWGDGNQMRDFLFVIDLIKILLDSLKTDKYDNRIINVATGINVSVREVVELINEYIADGRVEIKWDTSKPIGARSKFLDNSRFLSITPDFKFTDIREGIRKTVEWHLAGNKYAEVEKWL